jgi:hypothetical protein
MSVSDEQDVFLARCARVGSAAAAAGAKLRKADGKTTTALVIERDGQSVTFPIVTDPVLWRATTVEEALLAVLVDARGWQGAHFDDMTLARLDAAEKSGVPAIKRDLSEELGRLESLENVLGGKDKLDALFAAADL